jgi:GMP synthase-like glutamine amidotransferase
MKIHYLQHVPFDGLGSIELWHRAGKYRLTETQLYQDETLPEVTESDRLIVLEGPMGVADEDEYPSRINQLMPKILHYLETRTGAE